MIATEQERATLRLVVDTLRPRLGPERRITIGQMQDACGFGNRRHCEEFLQLHWADIPFPVVNLDGLFRPTLAEHLNHYVDANKSRIRNIALRNRATIRAARAAGWPMAGNRFLDQPAQGELFAESKPRST